MRSWWARLGISGIGAAVALMGALSAQASAQATEQYRVMVVDLRPDEGADDDFGKDLAKALRKLINDNATHYQPVDEDEIKDAAKQFDLDMKELSCIRARQLASQMISVQLIFCGEYSEVAGTKDFAVRGMMFAPPGGGSEFPIADGVWNEDDYEALAQSIYSDFDVFTEQLRLSAFCADYYGSNDWAGAEDVCLRALDMKPDDNGTRLVYAMVQRELAVEQKEAGNDEEAQRRYEAAYNEALSVIEADGLNENALNLAGFLAATLERPEEARQHYGEYLTLDPGNAQVRMTVAYELATAGDPEGAMQLIEEGLELDSENVDLLLQHASFAYRAAQDAQPENGSEPISDEVREFYRKALDSYQGVYAVQAEEMDGAVLRNMVATYFELGQLNDAIEMGERALETHADNADLWSLYASVLDEAGRLDDAIAALDQLLALNPQYQNVRARQGNWMLESGRVDEALPYLQQAVENGEQTADAMANLLFGTGYNGGIAPDAKDYPYALKLFEMAKTFSGELSEGMAGQLDFWHGYVLYNQAVEQEKPQTLQTAQASMPKFQEAQRLFGLARVAAYANGASIGLQQFRDGTQQYIEIQAAIIQRGN